MISGLYPKIAADGIRKNGRLYIPYIVTCILMITVFYIMHMLGFSDLMQNFFGVGTAKDILKMGTYILAIFGTIFLFYSQSTLIKGRLKEFGLYSVLGMNRRNIGRIIFYETFITWAVCLAGGLAAGIGLSKLAELGFCKMIAADTNYNFVFSGSSAACTTIVYSIIFFLLYLNALRQVRFASTINLIHSEKAGEKPPKANWAVGILGLLILLSGYSIALTIEQPLSALQWFFVAVILVIIGTYLVLIAGSVVLCRILQKNRNYYYKTNHFVSVSSMAYRMRRNGAGLASICILLTMILVMISSSSALYLNREETLRNHYPRQINCFASNYGCYAEYDDAAANLEADILNRLDESGIETSGIISITDCTLSGYFEDGRVRLDIDPMNSFTAIDYDRVAQVFFYDIDTYNRLTGSDEVLSSGEALVGVQGKLQFDDTIGIGDETFRIVKSFDPLESDLRHSIVNTVVSTIFVVVDLDAVAPHYNSYIDPAGDPMLMWQWRYFFDTDLDEEEQIMVGNSIRDYIQNELRPLNCFQVSCDIREHQRDDFVKTFGGLFFLGILLSVIFLVSCVLIIYYKQISEGFEDRSRFEIMQKVGMTKESIRESINTQMLTVFIIPIIFACVHLAVVLPIIHKLLMLFGHNNTPLLLTCAGVCILICSVFYTVIYKFTSNAYYKIVS